MVGWNPNLSPRAQGLLSQLNNSTSTLLAAFAKYCSKVFTQEDTTEADFMEVLLDLTSRPRWSQISKEVVVLSGILVSTLKKVRDNPDAADHPIVARALANTHWDVVLQWTVLYGFELVNNAGEPVSECPMHAPEQVFVPGVIDVTKPDPNLWLELALPNGLEPAEEHMEHLMVLEKDVSFC